ncbi:hypothetical protein [Dactylosporangium sucinum]|uniref:hypothetical protein n=1 Tax=Dactylosporangium sucinum TaxID=1424081 RepID=UPI00167C73AF
MLRSLLVAALLLPPPLQQAPPAQPPPISSDDRVYTADQTSNTVTVIDPHANRVLGTVALGSVRMDTGADTLGAMYDGQLDVHGLGFSRDGRYLDVIDVTTNAAHVVDTATNRVGGSSIVATDRTARLRHRTDPLPARPGRDHRRRTRPATEPPLHRLRRPRHDGPAVRHRQRRRRDARGPRLRAVLRQPVGPGHRPPRTSQRIAVRTGRLRPGRPRRSFTRYNSRSRQTLLWNGTPRQASAPADAQRASSDGYPFRSLEFAVSAG